MLIFLWIKFSTDTAKVEWTLDDPGFGLALGLMIGEEDPAEKELSKQFKVLNELVFLIASHLTGSFINKILCSDVGDSYG